MKTRRFQKSYRKSASKLHRTVGDVLRSSSLFKNYQIYQEYPVSRVNTAYTSNSEHFDWVIPDIQLVIECHGRQHYEVTDFSGKEEDGGLSKFKAQQGRDTRKRLAATEAGYTYIVIKYSDKNIDEDFIWNLYKANQNNELALEPITRKKQTIGYNKDKRQEYLKSERHQSILALARNHRKELYKRAKEQKNARLKSETQPELHSSGTSEDEP